MRRRKFTVWIGSGLGAFADLLDGLDEVVRVSTVLDCGAHLRELSERNDRSRKLKEK
jgi:hypothetical protein